MRDPQNRHKHRQRSNAAHSIRFSHNVQSFVLLINGIVYIRDGFHHPVSPVSYTHLDVYKRQVHGDGDRTIVKERFEHGQQCDF